jgi:hypothetical protein
MPSDPIRQALRAIFRELAQRLWHPMKGQIEETLSDLKVFDH